MSVLFFNSTIHKFLLLGSCTKIHTMSWQRNSQVISYTIKEGLTLIKPGSGRTVKYWDLISFDLAFTRFKFTYSGICQVGNRALQFREFSKNSVIPSVHWERAREQTRLRSCHPTILCMVQDRKLMKPWWVPRPSADHSCWVLLRTGVFWRSSKIRGGGGAVGRTFDVILLKCMTKRHFLMWCMM